MKIRFLVICLGIVQHTLQAQHSNETPMQNFSIECSDFPAVRSLVYEIEDCNCGGIIHELKEKRLAQLEEQSARVIKRLEKDGIVDGDCALMAAGSCFTFLGGVLATANYGAYGVYGPIRHRFFWGGVAVGMLGVYSFYNGAMGVCCENRMKSAKKIQNFLQERRAKANKVDAARKMSGTRSYH